MNQISIILGITFNSLVATQCPESSQGMVWQSCRINHSHGRLWSWIGLIDGVRDWLIRMEKNDPIAYSHDGRRIRRQSSLQCGPTQRSPEQPSGAGWQQSGSRTIQVEQGHPTLEKKVLYWTPQLFLDQTTFSAPLLWSERVSEGSGENGRALGPPIILG